MAWTDPAGHVWTTGEKVTAANMNTFIRLNLEETAPDKVTTAGDLVRATGANALTRLGIGAIHSLLVSDGSIPVWGTVTSDEGDATYTSGPSPGDPSTFQGLDSVNWGSGTAASVTVTTSNQARVDVHSRLQNDTAGALTSLSYAVSGATTSAANDIQGISFESSAANDRAQFGGWSYITLTAGSNTFALEAKVSAGQSTLTRPRIFVTPY